MSIIQLSQVTKRFGELTAVDDLSFAVEAGEIFGLLGPNGAGKTTTIRLALDIFRPDQGQIAVLGGPMDEAKKNRIGYMPEERGLYQEAPLERCLVYLGSLKGLSRGEARQRVQGYLERFDLAAYRHNKIKTLSKGMQQKAQIIATVLHQPELLIVDEPFSGLDPVNTRLVKELLTELRSQDSTIVMSTHYMHQVEEMCDRILLINRGKQLLYGNLAQVRQRFSGHAVWVRVSQLPTHLPGVLGVEPVNGRHKLTLEADTTPAMALQMLLDQGMAPTYFEVDTPTLDEIFVRVVRSGGLAEEA